MTLQFSRLWQRLLIRGFRNEGGIGPVRSAWRLESGNLAYCGESAFPSAFHGSNQWLGRRVRAIRGFKIETWGHPRIAALVIPLVLGTDLDFGRN
jgi:hypothetical protein